MAAAGEPHLFDTTNVRPIGQSERPAQVSSNSVDARWSDVQRRRIGPGIDAWKFRWKSEPSASLLSSSVRAVNHQSFGKVDTEVQLAAYYQDANQLDTDPFSDPFGDRTDAPTPPPAPPEDPETETEFFDFQGPADSGFPVPPPEQEPVVQPSPTPITTYYDQESDTDYDRVYNDRNCCDHENGCRHAREVVLADTISTISLDITPQFTLAKLSTEGREPRSYEEEVEAQMARAPSRVWRNRGGEVVADGSFTDLRNGKVVITGGDGETVRIAFSELSEDDICFVTAYWSIPSECTLGDQRFAGRVWTPSTLTWKASALCHKPLYYEERHLERYGHTAGPFVQPVLSGAHFFMNVATLPYQMGISPPTECEYALGYYRPGNCAPWLVPPVPLSLRAALLEAGTFVGGVFMIP